jgi:hypothetical protein
MVDALGEWAVLVAFEHGEFRYYKGSTAENPSEFTTVGTEARLLAGLRDRDRSRRESRRPDERV